MILDYILNILVPIIIHILEVIGVFIIIFSALKSFINYARRFFDFSNDNIKIEFAKGLALALEFKLGAEILKTLTIRTLDEMLILASIVLLRVVLTFVIHWEIESDTKRHHDFLKSKEITKENQHN
jgi:uncharacterized membrane protein